MPYLTKQFLNAVVLLLTLFAMSQPLQAEAATMRSAKSISYASDLAKEETARKTELDQADVEIMDTLVEQGFRPESMPAAVYVDSIIYHDGDITIYDASTTLISDFDDDGFYHRFSVAIDADTIFSESWVYARLYLSYEGGPWNYYATSADFVIHGDSELDVFVVETELAEGFPAGYYDIRIELYDAEFGDLLLTYGPYDDDALSTLPLEDSVYDDDYSSVAYSTEVIVAGSGGISFWLLAVFALAGVIRSIRRHYSQRRWMPVCEGLTICYGQQ